MIKYYKLFDLLTRRGMKKTDLLKIMSSRTLAKLSKGETVSSDVIDKICLHLECQPNDIMEVFEVYEKRQEDGTVKQILCEITSSEKREFEYIMDDYFEQKRKSYENTRKKMEENN